MGQGKCQYCGRPTATDICPAHGYVGNPQREEADKIPIGLIALWSGTVATIPHLWALCDGTLGTPDLRDRFVLGGGTTTPGTTGGSNASHTHSTTVSGGGGGTSGAGSTHYHSTPALSHSWTYGGTGVATAASQYYVTGHTAGTTGSESSHTHEVAGYSGGAFTSGGNSTFPVAYYALAYIMKIGG